MVLGNVISVFGDSRRKSLYILYRDVKIIRFLKDFLGGSVKIVMIVCVSLFFSDFDEFLNFFKYVNRVRNIRNKFILNFSLELDRMDEMEFEIKLFREVL